MNLKSQNATHSIFGNSGDIQSSNYTGFAGYVTSEAILFNQDVFNSNYESIYPNIQLVNPSELSVSFWIEIKSFSDYKDIFKIIGNNTILSMGINISGFVGFNIVNTQEGVETSTTMKEFEILSGKWYHYTITIDKQYNLLIYQNGVIQYTSFYQAVFQSEDKELFLENEVLTIVLGGQQNGASMLIDDFRIYNEIIEFEEIRCLGEICDGKCDTCELKSNNCNGNCMVTEGPLRIPSEECMCEQNLFYDSYDQGCFETYRQKCLNVPPDFIYHGNEAYQMQFQGFGYFSDGFLTQEAMGMDGNQFYQMAKNIQYGGDSTFTFQGQNNDDTFSAVILSVSNDLILDVKQQSSVQEQFLITTGTGTDICIIIIMESGQHQKCALDIFQQGNGYNHYIVSITYEGIIKIYFNGVEQQLQTIEDTYQGGISNGFKSTTLFGADPYLAVAQGGGEEIPGIPGRPVRLRNLNQIGVTQPINAILDDFRYYNRILDNNEMICLNDQCIDSNCQFCNYDQSCLEVNCSIECLSCDIQHPQQCIEFCDFKCQGCTQSVDNCTECKGNRQGVNCECPVSYYDDEQSMNCQNCHYSCLQCDISACSQCKGLNRIISQLDINICNCIANSYDYYFVYGVLDCQTCETGIFIPTLSDNYQQIRVFFLTQIQIPDYNTNNIGEDSFQLCEYLIENETLQTLGEYPLCNLGSDNQTLYITLGRGPIINQNGLINLKINKIQQISSSGCDSTVYFTQFSDNNYLRLPENPQNPFIVLSGPNSEVNLCTDISIKVIKIFNDGFRGLQDFQFSIVDSSENDVTQNLKLMQILQENNDQNKNYLQIPPLVLKAYSSYTFQVSFSNFLGFQGSQTIQLLTSDKYGTTSQIIQETPFLLNNWQRNTFLSEFSYVECQNGEFVKQEKQLEVIWQDITQEGNSIELQKKLTNKQQKTDSFVLEQYVKIPGIYKLQVLVKVPDSNQMSKHYVEYTIKNTPLINFIEGGNRLQGYSSPLILSAQVKDIDVQEHQQQQNISIVWSCENMISQQQCQNIEGQVIDLSSETSNQIEFDPKYFLPYNTFLYQVNAVKSTNNKQKISQAIIIVVETELPLLTVKIPDNLLSQKVNMNDKIQVEVFYDNLNQSEDLYYSLVILYKLDIVASKTFTYKKFAFKIWDLFTEFQSDKPNFVLRVSLYDPYYFMPSEASFNIQINMQPIIGNIVVSPLEGGIAMDTLFSIQLNSFYDEDQPLTYKYMFYIDGNTYQNEKLMGDSINSQKNILQDFSNQNQLSTYLPQGILGQSVPYDLTILVSVADSYGAITNKTEIINIKPLQQDENILEKYEKIKNQSLIKSLPEYIVQDLNCLVLQIAQDKKNCDILIQNQNNNISKDLWCQQKQFYDFQSNLYQILQSYNDVDIINSQSIRNQIVKSLNLLIKNNEVQILQTEIDQTLLQINNILNQSEQTIQDMKINNILNQGDSKSTQVLDNINQNIGQVFSFIDQLITVDEKNQINNRVLNEQEQVNNQQDNIVNIAKKTIKVYQQGSLPNTDTTDFKGDNIRVQIDKGTNKRIDSLYFEQQNSVNNGFTVTNNKKEQNFNVDEQMQNQDYVIYDASFTAYKNNPYQNSTYFPYKNQNKQGQDIDINLENMEVEIQTLGKNITTKFNPDENSDNNVCIQKEESGWKSKHCETQQREDEDQNIFIECKCQDLSYTTIVDDLNFLFTESNLQEAFQEDGVQAILEFEFYKSAIFYIFLLQILINILIFPQIYKLDKKSYQQKNNKIAPEYSPLKKKQQTNINQDTSQCSSNSQGDQIQNLYTYDVKLEDFKKMSIQEKRNSILQKQPFIYRQETRVQSSHNLELKNESQSINNDNSNNELQLQSKETTSVNNNFFNNKDKIQEKKNNQQQRKSFDDLFEFDHENQVNFFEEINLSDDENIKNDNDNNKNINNNSLSNDDNKKENNINNNQEKIQNNNFVNSQQIDKTKQENFINNTKILEKLKQEKIKKRMAQTQGSGGFSFKSNQNRRQSLQPKLQNQKILQQDNKNKIDRRNSVNITSNRKFSLTNQIQSIEYNNNQLQKSDIMSSPNSQLLNSPQQTNFDMLESNKSNKQLVNFKDRCDQKQFTINNVREQNNNYNTLDIVEELGNPVEEENSPQKQRIRNKQQTVLRNEIVLPVIDQNQDFIQNDNVSQQKNKENKEEQVKTKENLVKKDILKGIVEYHEFLEIFYIENEELYRCARLALYFLKIIISLCITSLFTSVLTQLQTILSTLVISVFTGIPMLVLKSMLGIKKKKIVNIIAVILYFIILILMLYISFVNAALMKLEKSNQWAIDYSFTVLLEIFMMQVLEVIFKLWLFRKTIGKQGKLVRILQNKLFTEMKQYFQS